ncbi:MAG: lipoyl(octanoyl) transferase LipB, partial [Aeromonas sp.]
GMTMTQTSVLGGPQSVTEAQRVLVAELAKLIGYDTIIHTEEPS